MIKLSIIIIIIANKHTWGKKYEVKPFSRLLIVAKVPNADEYMDQFDHLVLVKYSKDPVDLLGMKQPKAKDSDISGPKVTESKNENADISVEPVKNSKCYLLEKIHDEIKESECAFKYIDGPVKGYFNGRNNWEILTTVEPEMVLIAWSPVVYKHGSYSPRYAVSSYVCDDLDFNQLKCDKSSTTYYKGNMQEYCNSKSGVKGSTDKEPLGPMIYCSNIHALAYAVPHQDGDSDDDDDDDDEATTQVETVPVKAVQFLPMYKDRYVLDFYEAHFYTPSAQFLYIFGKPVIFTLISFRHFSRRLLLA